MCGGSLCGVLATAAMHAQIEKLARTITRIEHEEIWPKPSGARMATPEAKKIYKLRGQTIEQPFAEVKENRGMRRFCRRGLRM